MSKKISLRGKIEFFREIRSIFTNGYNLSSSYHHLHSVLGQSLKTALKSGTALSTILGRFNFSPEEIFLLRAGEASGDLVAVINALLEHYQNQQKLLKRLKKILAYPLITLMFAILIFSGFIIFVLPKFAEIYCCFGVDKKISLVGHPSFFIAGLLLLLLLILSLKINFQKVKGYFQQKVWLFREKFLFSLLFTLSLLLQTGGDLIGFIEVSASQSSFKVNLHRLVFYLKKGRTLADALVAAELLKTNNNNLIRQAELNGELKNVLATQAAELREEYFEKLERLVLLVEPATIILTGIFVGYLSITIIRPLILLSQSML